MTMPKRIKGYISIAPMASLQGHGTRICHHHMDIKSHSNHTANCSNSVELVQAVLEDRGKKRDLAT